MVTVAVLVRVPLLEVAMLRARFGWMLVLSTALTMQSHWAFAQAPTILGTWTGTVAQNAGKSNYSVVMTITSTGAETNYPELNCGGKLRRIGTSKGYVFFMETITRGGKNSGGTCIDGAVTVAPAGTNWAWGWVGSYGGQVYVAWSNLVRK
jgi:hypothetical protein